MSCLQKICSDMKLTEVKKLRVQKTLLSLMVEWKDLDDSKSSSSSSSFADCLAELEAREKNLNSLRESVEESNRVVEAIRESVEGRLQESVCNEKELKLLWNELCFKAKNAELREGKLDSQQKLIEGFLDKFNLEKDEFERVSNLVGERFKEMKSKEKCIENHEVELRAIASEFDIKQRRVLAKSKEVRLKEKSLVSIQSLNEERREELDSREKQLDLVKNDFDSKIRRLELEKKLVEERFKDLQLKEKHFKEWVKSIDLKEKEIDLLNISSEERCRQLEIREKELEEKLKEFELKEKYFKEWVKNIDLKEKEIDSVNISSEERCRELEIREKQLDEKLRAIESKEKEINLTRLSSEERCREIELWEKQLRNRLKEFELKEKIFTRLVKTEPLEDDCSYADVRFSTIMDAKGLQLNLNKRERDLDLMADEVSKALKLSKDPAKLVLDAMEGFYPPHLKKGDKESGGNVVRRTCIRLLEQLRKISPQIKTHVKEAALKLAGVWKAKMTEGVEDCLEVIGFLQLLASYGLGDDFEPGGLLQIFERVGQQEQIMELCQVLCYTDKISDLVQHLVKEKQHIMSVRYVCAFGLRDKFEPASLLKDFFKHVEEESKTLCENRKNSVDFSKHAEEESKTLCENRKNSVDAKNEAIDNIVASLRDALECIKNHNLESEYSPKYLEIFIEQLTTQKSLEFLDQIQRKGERKNELVTKQLDYEAIGSISDLTNAMAVILAHMDGKSLLFLLNEHFKDHELICNQVSIALRLLSDDSAKFVLSAIQEGFHPPHGILLLEQLMRLSPEIEPRVKEEALKLALDWKAKMSVATGSYLEILSFLELTSAYGITSAFDLSELEKLFESVAEHRHALELCRVFGYSAKNTVKTIISSSSSVCPWHDVNPSDAISKREAKRQNLIGSSFMNCVSDPAKLALDAIRGCNTSDLNSTKSKEIVMKSLLLLLEEVLKILPEIKPHIKEEALKFALEWKAQLLESNLKPSEVLVFFHLLAIYKLASSFDADELFGLFQCVRQRKSAPTLSRLLGLAHKIPSLIQSLIKKQDRLMAIKYIYEFGLVKKFPPVPILKAHLSYSEMLAFGLRKERGISAEVEGKAINKELAALRTIVNCITDHRLEPQYPPEKLLARIEQLESEKAKWNLFFRSDKSLHSAPAPPPAPAPAQGSKHSKAKSQGKLRKRCHAKAPDFPCRPPSEWKHLSKRPRFEPLAEASGNLLILSNKYMHIYKDLM